MCETDKSSETCEPTHPAQPNEPGETCQSSALWSDGCVGEFVREFQLGLAMRLFLLMPIDAHQMRINAHKPHQ